MIFPIEFHYFWRPVQRMLTFSLNINVFSFSQPQGTPEQYWSCRYENCFHSKHENHRDPNARTPIYIYIYICTMHVCIHVCVFLCVYIHVFVAIEESKAGTLNLVGRSCLR